MIQIEYNHTDGILEVTPDGEFNVFHLLDTIDKTFTHKNLSTSKLLLLEDARKAKTKFTLEEIDMIISRLKMHFQKFSSIRHAVVHSDPLNTAYTLVVKEKTNDPKYQIAVFSTVEAAKHWLLNPKL